MKSRAIRISQLQKRLAQLKRKHGDVEVVYGRWSDTCVFEEDDLAGVEAITVVDVPGSAGEWVRRKHDSEPEDTGRVVVFII